MQSTVCPTTVVTLLSLAMLALVALLAVAGGVALVVALLQRQGHERRQSERILRECERIKAMAAAGRISAEEAAELLLALGDTSTANPDSGPPHGRLQKTARPILFGVCGGLAEWLRWDATLVRLAYTLATFLVAGFPGVIVYVILALVMPTPEGATRSKARGIILGLLAAAAILAALLMLLCLGAFTGRVRAH